MTVSESMHRAQPAPDGSPIMLLPTHPPRLGPVSRRLLWRLVAVLCALQLLAAILVFVVGGHTASTAGLSIVLPGGGFLYVASPILFVLTAVALIVALVLWWGVSAHFAIPLVWVSAGAVAVVLVDGPRLLVDRGTYWQWSIPVVYVAAAATVGSMVWRVERGYRRKLAKIPDLNEYLRTAQLPVRITSQRTLDRTDAQLLQWCYDFAFQPDDGLDGLDWGEQFHGGTQLRYQLNSVSWAMSLYAADRKSVV